MTRIMFRFDAGQTPEVGTGHASRCSQLARQLEAQGDVEIGFAIQDSEFARQFAASPEWKGKARLFPEGDAKACEEEIGKFSPDVLVIDGLDTDAEFMGRAKKLCKVLVTLDDRGNGAKEADVVINGIVEGGDTPYSGPRYVMVSPEIKGLKSVGRECRRIFVTFGGYDHLNLTLKAAKALEKLGPEKEVVIVVGAAYLFWDELQAFLKKAGRKFEVHRTPKNYAQLLLGSDLAITNGGLSFFEAMAAGVPALAIAQYPHQAATAEKFRQKGAAEFLGMGDETWEDAILERAEKMISDCEGRARMARRAQGLVDGEGLARVAELVRVVQHKRWDSEFFGVKIANVNVSRMNERIAAFVEEWCGKNGIACLFYLCDCNHAESVRVAEGHGYGFKDIRMHFEMNMEGFSPRGAEGNPVRECAREDLVEIKKIAWKSYAKSRYYYDGHFEEARLEKFYSNWLENTFNSPSGKVLVAAEKGGKPFGYVSGEIDNRGRLGRIILVGVEEKHAGSGVGKALVDAMLNFMHERKVYAVEVVTQGRNLGAQRLYQKCGFKIALLSLWYHKWF